MQAIRFGERMYTEHIRWVACHALDPWCQGVATLLLEKNGTEAAITYVLGEIDCWYQLGEMSFVDAANAYNLLLPAQSRVLRFPQLRLKNR